MAGNITTDSHRSDRQAQLFRWQSALLRVVLLASGGAFVVGTALSVAFRGGAVYYLYATGVTGLLLLALSTQASSAPRALSYGYVATALATLATVGVGAAWAPSVVAGLCSLLVLAGLLLGPRVVFVLLATMATLLVVGGLAVSNGAYSPTILPPLDPSRFINWVRVGIILVMITGATAWALRLAQRTLVKAEAEARVALAALRTEMALTEDTRSRRLARETALRDAQKLQTVAQLGQGFAHLLNNVLTVVRSVCQEARQPGSTLASSEAAERIISAAEPSSEKTRDLLFLSQPHPGDHDPIVVHEALAEIGQGLDARLRENIRCELDLQPVGTVRMPRSWLEQMTMNLLLNAEQAMPEGGRVRLATRIVRIEEVSDDVEDPLLPKNYAAVIVTDTGPGISADVALRACEPFFTTKGRDAHDGLGLTITYSMAQDLGGSFDISSDDSGTTATLYFPLIESASSTSANDPTTLPPQIDASHEPPGPPEAMPTDAGSIADLESQPPPVWKVTALEQLLKVAAIVAFTGLVATALMLRSPLALFILAVGIPIVVLLALAAWRTTWPFHLRLGILLSAGVVFSSALLLKFSFLNPSPVALVVMSVLVTAVYAPKATPYMLAGALGVFLLGGWLHGSGIIVSPIAAVSPEHATNWFRFAAIVVPLCLVVAFAALSVFNSLRSRLGEMAHALADLEIGRERRVAETRALARVEQMAQRTHRMEAAGHLTGMVAHDLNNCLQVIVGWAELLKVARTDDDRAEALHAIDQSTNYAEALVHKLQLDAPVAPGPESLDIGAALDRMEHMLKEIAHGRDKSPTALEVTRDAECFAAVDEMSLRRLVLNLAANAREAMKDGGICTVALVREAESVALSVADTGTGMDAETRAQMFEPFFSTKGHQGTGLGLHSVNEIVKATGGDLDVWSEPGSGSRFTVRWPLSPPPTKTVVQAGKGNVSPTSARVLLAEDDPLVRQTLVTGLTRSGYRVTEAQDGSAAVDLIEGADEFDILCTDAVMPGIPTPEVIDAFCLRFPGRPVVLISGYLPATVGATALTNPDVTYLQKPFSVADLTHELERRLGTPH